MRSVPRFIAIAGAAAAVTVLVASSALAANGRSGSDDGVHFFQGTKTCTQSDTPPLATCVMTGDVPLLEGASVAYISVPLFFADPAPSGRIDSDVRLTAAAKADSSRSTANGHCTFYTTTGLCTYSGGTRKLGGFHAVFVIGTNADGSFSVIGKYWFSGDNRD